jgi:hypothetical protein
MSTTTATSHVPYYVVEREQREAKRTAALPAFLASARAVGAEFQIKVTTVEQLRIVLRGQDNNHFVPDAMVDAFAPLMDECSEVEVYEFIGGPKVYFRIPFWTHQRLSERHGSGGMGTEIGLEGRKDLAARLRAAGQSVRADAIGTVQRLVHVGGQRTPDNYFGIGEDPTAVSVWWD